VANKEKITMTKCHHKNLLRSMEYLLMGFITHQKRMPMEFLLLSSVVGGCCEKKNENE